MGASHIAPGGWAQSVYDGSAWRRYGQIEGYVAVTGTSYNVTDNDRHVLIDQSTADPVTVTLPASPVDGHVIEVMDIKGTAGANNVTIARNGNSINNAASDEVISANFGSRKLIYRSSASSWYILNAG